MTVRILDGVTRDDLIELLHTEERTPEQAKHFETLKREFADRLMAGTAAAAYEVDGPD